MKKNISLALTFFCVPVFAMDLNNRALIHEKINALKKENPAIDMRMHKAALLKQAKGMSVQEADAIQKESELRPALLRSKEFQNNTVCSACYMPKGDLVVGLDYNLVVLDPNDLTKQKLSVNCPNGVYNLAANPHCPQVAFSDASYNLNLLNIETGQPIAQLPESAVYDIQYNNDGTQLLISTTDGCYIYDLKSNTKIQNSKLAALKNASAQWDSDDNNYIATCTDKILRIWDLREDEPAARIEAAVPLYHPRFAANGKGRGIAGGELMLCAAPGQFVTFGKYFYSDPRIRYHDLYGKKTKDNQPVPIPNPTLPAICLNIVPKTDNTKVVASLNNAGCQIVGFDLKDNSDSDSFYFDNTGNTGWSPITTLACSPDGKAMASAGFADTLLNIWYVSLLKKSVTPDPVVDKTKGAYAWHPVRPCNVQ